MISPNYRRYGQSSDYFNADWQYKCRALRKRLPHYMTIQTCAILTSTYNRSLHKKQSLSTPLFYSIN